MSFPSSRLRSVPVLLALALAAVAACGRTPAPVDASGASTSGAASASGAATAGPGTSGGSASSVRTSRPCEIAVRSCTKGGRPCPADTRPCGVALARFNPDGDPLDLVLDKPTTLRWKYAPDGRLLESPTYTYRSEPDGSGVRRAREGGKDEPVRFDAAGNLVAIGDGFKLEYTPDGRTSKLSSRDGAKWHEVTYAWDAKQSFKVSWTFPDADEYCEPDPSRVDLDARGRVARESFESCQINYSPFSLAYEYDDANRPRSIDVQCHPGDAEATAYRLDVKYQCD